jgi:hypothetical protein
LSVLIGIGERERRRSSRGPADLPFDTPGETPYHRQRGRLVGDTLVKESNDAGR